MIIRFIFLLPKYHRNLSTQIFTHGLGTFLGTLKSGVINLSDVLASPYEGASDDIVWYGLSPSEEKIIQSEFGAGMLRGIIISSVPNEKFNKIKSRYKMSSSITSLNLVANSSILDAPSSPLFLLILVVMSVLW